MEIAVASPGPVGTPGWGEVLTGSIVAEMQAMMEEAGCTCHCTLSGPVWPDADGIVRTTMVHASECVIKGDETLIVTLS